jgi:hypothetical protein
MSHIKGKTMLAPPASLPPVIAEYAKSLTGLSAHEARVLNNLITDPRMQSVWEALNDRHPVPTRAYLEDDILDPAAHAHLSDFELALIISFQHWLNIVSGEEGDVEAAKDVRKRAKSYQNVANQLHKAAATIRRDIPRSKLKECPHCGQLYPEIAEHVQAIELAASYFDTQAKDTNNHIASELVIEKGTSRFQMSMAQMLTGLMGAYWDRPLGGTYVATIMNVGRGSNVSAQNVYDWCKATKS